MTNEQILKISKQAAASCGATLYGTPKLEGGIWTIGFKQPTTIMALQVTFSDHEIVADNDLYRTELELERTMRGAILLST